MVVKFDGGGASAATVTDVFTKLRATEITTPTLTATTADINGGTIDNSVIGGSTAAAVTGTAVVANTSLNIAGDGATVTGIKDEDNMASNSATKLATQQSIKAYVDSQVGTVDTWAEVLANGATSGSTNPEVTAGQALKTNTINETSAGSGVTIDSVLLKDDVVNATDVETGSISANDGTASATIANSTGNFTITNFISNSVDIGGGAIDGTTIGGSSAAAGTFSQVNVDNITIDGSAITSSGSLSLDIGGNLTIDVDGTTITLADGGANWGQMFNSAQNFYFKNPTADKDIVFQGIDGSTAITMLTLDASLAGQATFGGNLTVQGADVTITGNVIHAGDTNTYFGFHDADQWRVVTGGTERIEITNTEVVINDSSVDMDFRVESDSNANMLLVNGGNNSVSIGTSTSEATFTVGGSATFNADSADADFRVESSGNANMLFVDGGNDRVGVGGSPSSPFHVHSGDTNNVATFTSTDSTAVIMMQDNSGNAQFGVSGNTARISPNSSYAVFEASQTAVVINNASQDTDFRVESDGNANMLFVEGSSNRVYVGGSTNVNTSALQVTGQAAQSAVVTKVVDNNYSLFQGFNASNALITQITGAGVLTHNGAATFSSTVTTGGTTRINGELQVTAASGKDRFVIAPQAAGSGSFLISFNEAANNYEPVIFDFENLNLRTAGVGRLLINSTEVVLNDGSTSQDFRVESDSNTHMLFVDGGSNEIGINQSSPASTLHVTGRIQTDQFQYSGGDGSATRIGRHLGWSQDNSSSSGSTWRKVGVFSLPDASFSSISLLVRTVYAGSNYGAYNASAQTFENQCNVTRKTTGVIDSADIFGANNPYLQLHRNSVSEWELQSRTVHDNQGVDIQVLILTSAGGAGFDVTNGISAGTTGGTVVSADGATAFTEYHTTIASYGGATFNEGSADVDFRVESDSSTHALFVDGGNNHVNINTSLDAGGTLNVAGDIFNDLGANKYFRRAKYIDPRGVSDGVFAGYLLLVPYNSGSAAVGAAMEGTFIAHRGNSGTGNGPSRCQVWCSAVYTNTLAWFKKEGADQFFQRLVRVTYSGTEYMALEFSQVNGGPVNGIYFDGWSLRADSNFLFMARDTEITGSVVAFDTPDPYHYIETTNNQRFNYGVTFNEAGGNHDFRVESDSNTHALFVDGANGNFMVGAASIAAVNSIVTSHLMVGANSTAGAGAVGVYNNTGTANCPAFVVLNRDTSTDTSNRFVQFYANVTSSGATAMGGIVGNGASNVQFAALSDAREKTNIESITGSLDKITSLNPVEFDWIASGEHVSAGFVAQDVEEVFPEFVVENMADEGAEERKGLTGGMTGGIVAHLVKAIQEQQELIKTLEARIAALES